MERLTHDELAAKLAGETAEARNELRMEQIAPGIGRYQVDLVIRDGHAEAVEDVLSDTNDWVQSLLQVRDGRVVLYQAADRTYAGYGNLYAALVALAPHVEDVRFSIGEWDEHWIDEYWIAGGVLRAERGFADERGEFWAERARERPDDDELRRFAAHESLARAEYWLGGIDRGERRKRARAATVALDRAESLEPDNPWLWQLRGRLLRATGALADAERAFARQAELAPSAEATFDLAIVAFTRRDDTRARELLAELDDSHTLGQLLAAYLARKHGGAERHLRAMLAAIDQRRRAISPIDEVRQPLVWLGLEPAHEDLTRTGRHGAALAWCMKAVAELADLRAPAAALLLGWAEVFRIRRAHGRNRVEAGKLARALYAAAARLDPLGGSVHYYWSLMLSGRAEQKKLAEGFALAPDHLGIVGTLGARARKARDYDRAIELLERYLTRFRALHDGGIWGLYYDFHRTELAIAHYERACMFLYGVPPGANRPPGKPSLEALDRTEAALAPALAMYDSLSYEQRREGCGVFQCMSLVEEYRGHHERALEWVDRALEANEDSAYCMSTKGGCLNNLGRLDEAIEWCERALAADPNHWHAHYVIACALAKQGRARPRIYDHLRRVVALWPEGRAELAVEPDLDSLRGSPAFRKIVSGSSRTASRGSAPAS